MKRSVSVGLWGAAALVPMVGCSAELPENDPVKEARWLEQNWNPEERFWFHHASQGTASVLIPYGWFLALEQPTLWWMGAPPLFSDTAYLTRYVPFRLNRFAERVLGSDHSETEHAKLKDEFKAFVSKAKDLLKGSKLREKAIKRNGGPVAVKEGFARFDTSIPGNRNTGHEFRDGPSGSGVIGPVLSEAERWDLIEYLKSL
ncbi:MAG: hypothetical protein U9Q81_06325 [Pseudomonadota bacterium]|nr:hypothetical protein [Pseudomonadota bacterium]